MTRGISRRSPGRSGAASPEQPDGLGDGPTTRARGERGGMINAGAERGVVSTVPSIFRERLVAKLEYYYWEVGQRGRRAPTGRTRSWPGRHDLGAQSPDPCPIRTIGMTSPHGHEEEGDHCIEDSRNPTAD